MLTLTIETLQVIVLRLRLIPAGRTTSDEMFLVNEKIEALAEARTILIRGGDPVKFWFTALVLPKVMGGGDRQRIVMM